MAGVWQGVISGVAVLTGIGGLGFVGYEAKHQTEALYQRKVDAQAQAVAKSESAEASSKKKDASLKKTASTKRASEKKASERDASKQLEADQAAAAANDVPEPTENVSAAEQQTETNTGNQSVAQSTETKAPTKTENTDKAPADKVDNQPRNQSRDPVTDAYVEAGVMNPQGGMTYSPEIESKAQSILERDK
ncbi:hypothetical protein [Weissella minor]|uniref:Uncharacterized protein n=1 Tax=Weissella minor TaxID=1620 RepID=A0A0R2JHI4_9LACO|nr:hypothetical protein [Weissella minor]KRN76767.1 hypothetical protein IV67_GL000274 [Weissella minor]